MKRTAKWRVNTPALLQEIVRHNPTTNVLRIPIAIFGELLYAVGERASELNDPKLNELMCRLALYEVADPYSPEYDSKLVDTIMKSENL